VAAPQPARAQLGAEHLYQCFLVVERRGLIYAHQGDDCATRKDSVDDALIEDCSSIQPLAFCAKSRPSVFRPGSRPR
jgi:hypothetical protein